jgi:hypothetical protein
MGGKTGKTNPSSSASLQDEIELVRVLIRQARGLVDEGLSLDELLKSLDVVSRACARLAGLLKAQRQLDDTPDLGTALAQVFDEMIKNS